MIPRRVVRDLERQLGKEPGNLAVRVTLAAAYRELGQTAESVEQYRLVARGHLQERRADEALAACATALAMTPDDRELLAMQEQARAAQAAAPARPRRTGLDVAASPVRPEASPVRPEASPVRPEASPVRPGELAARPAEMAPARPLSRPGERSPGASGHDLETPLPPPMPLHDSADSLVGLPVGVVIDHDSHDLSLPSLPPVPATGPIVPSLSSLAAHPPIAPTPPAAVHGPTGSSFAPSSSSPFAPSPTALSPSGHAPLAPSPTALSPSGHAPLAPPPLPPAPADAPPLPKAPPAVAPGLAAGRGTLMGPGIVGAPGRGIPAGGALPKLSTPPAPQPRPGALPPKPARIAEPVRPAESRPERMPRRLVPELGEDEDEAEDDAFSSVELRAETLRADGIGLADGFTVDEIDEVDVAAPVVALTDVRKLGERPSAPDLTAELETRRRPRLSPHELDLLELDILVASDDEDEPRDAEEGPRASDTDEGPRASGSGPQPDNAAPAPAEPSGAAAREIVSAAGESPPAASAAAPADRDPAASDSSIELPDTAIETPALTTSPAVPALPTSPAVPALPTSPATSALATSAATSALSTSSATSALSTSSATSALPTTPYTPAVPSAPDTLSSSSISLDAPIEAADRSSAHEDSSSRADARSPRPDARSAESAKAEQAEPSDFDDEPTQPPAPGAESPERLHAALTGQPVEPEHAREATMAARALGLADPAAGHVEGDGGTFAGGFTGTLAELAPDGSALDGALGVFSMLPPDAANELARRAIVKLFDDGETIVREGDAGDACYVIARGEVVITRHGAGGEPPIELARLGEGALFGEFALLADRRRHATVTALGEAEIYVIPRLLLRELAAIYPDVGPALERFYRERLLANLIHTSPLFARLAVDQRAGLLTAFEPQRVESGHAIVRQGERAGGLFLIVLGAVEVVARTDDRRAVVLATLGEGAYVGEISLLTGEVATASVVACGPVELAALPAPAFYRVVSEYPELWAAMRDEASERRLRTARILAGRTGVV